MNCLRFILDSLGYRLTARAFTSLSHVDIGPRSPQRCQLRYSKKVVLIKNNELCEFVANVTSTQFVIGLFTAHAHSTANCYLSRLSM